MTPNMKLAGLLLGQPVEQWVQARRDEGMSWRKIEAALEAATNGQVAVEHETIRRWVGAA